MGEEGKEGAEGEGGRRGEGDKGGGGRRGGKRKGEDVRAAKISLKCLRNKCNLLMDLPSLVTSSLS